MTAPDYSTIYVKTHTFDGHEHDTFHVPGCGVAWPTRGQAMGWMNGWRPTHRRDVGVAHGMSR